MLSTAFVANSTFVARRPLPEYVLFPGRRARARTALASVLICSGVAGTGPLFRTESPEPLRAQVASTSAFIAISLGWHDRGPDFACSRSCCCEIWHDRDYFSTKFFNKPRLFSGYMFIPFYFRMLPNANGA
jgi:hypothetical protein